MRPKPRNGDRKRSLFGLVLAIPAPGNSDRPDLRLMQRVLQDAYQPLKLGINGYDCPIFLADNCENSRGNIERALYALTLRTYELLEAVVRLSGR